MSDGKRWFTDEEVHDICKMIMDGYANKEIAEMYGVLATTVSQIRCKKTYKHISSQYDMKSMMMTKEEIHTICKLIEEGMSNTDIALQFNISQNTVSLIRNGRLHREISKNYKLLPRNLRDSQVHEICQLIIEGKRNREISKIVNIAEDTISRIRNGKTHRNVTKLYDLNCKYYQIAESTVNEICKMMEDGYDNVTIMKKFGLGRCVVADIRRGKTYVSTSKKYNIPRIDKEYIDESIIHNICKLIEEGYKNIEISMHTSVSKQVISDIRCGKNHMDISKQYKFPPVSFQRRRVSDDKLHKACELLDKGEIIRKVAELSGLSTTTIERMKYTDVYSDITDQYNFKKNKKKG